MELKLNTNRIKIEGKRKLPLLQKRLKNWENLKGLKKQLALQLLVEILKKNITIDAFQKAEKFASLIPLLLFFGVCQNFCALCKAQFPP